MDVAQRAGRKFNLSHTAIQALVNSLPLEQLRLLGPCHSHFRSLTAIVESTDNGSTSGICPACFAQVLFLFEHLPSLVSSTRADSHGFWDACIDLVTARKSDAEIAALQRRLVSNADRCPIAHVEPLDTANPTEVYHDFFRAVFACLNLCFSAEGDARDYSLLSRVRVGKGFRFRKASNIWPISPQQLMPHGEQRTIESLVRWSCTLVCLDSIRALSHFVTVLRPHLFPYLLKPPLRPLFLWLLARLMLGDFENALEDWPGAEPCAPDSATVLDLDDDVMAFATSLVLTVLVSGPDAKVDDMQCLVDGYEAVLYRASGHAMHTLAGGQPLTPEVSKFIQPMFAPIRDFAISLHKRMGLPDTLLLPEVLRYMQATFNPHVNRERYSDSSHAMALFFKEMQDRRSCAGPDCAKVVQDNEGGRAFQRCGRCKLTAYCGRECQRADWKRGLCVPLREATRVTHKDVCPILCRVLAVVHITNTTVPAFVAEFRQVGLADEDLQILQDWVLATHVLPPDMAAEMAGLGDRAKTMSHDDLVQLGLADPRNG